MIKWKRHIETGHHLFACKSFQEAKFHYQMACKRAISLSFELGNEQETVMAAVVSHHGLAQLYTETGFSQLAQYEVEKLHYHLQSILDKEDLTDERRTIFLYGLQRTHVLLLQYMKTSTSNGRLSAKV